MPRAAKPYTIEKSQKPVKKIPASENGYGVHYTVRSGKQYYISQNPEKKRFTLWRVVKDGYEKMATSDNPYHLYPLAQGDT